MGSMAERQSFADESHHLGELATKDFWYALTAHRQIPILDSGTLAGWVEDVEQVEL